MSDFPPDLFGQPLQRDPAIALPPPPAAVPRKPGPLHRVEFVVELVGPRSVPAAAASRLLDADWYGALGSPRCHAMRASDTLWQPLTASRDGSYDSLAISWPYRSDRGNLTSAAADRLLTTAVQFGEAISRRAIPLPAPPEVDRAAAELGRIEEALDIGVAVVVAPARQPMVERELWIVCAALGLEFSPEGSFDWTPAGSPSPLFSVTPIGGTEAFSLAGVQANVRYEGITIGFSVPRCPAPAQALQGAFHAAEAIAARFHGRIFDDSGRVMSDRIRAEMTNGLQQGLTLFQKANLVPGSTEAIALFDKEH